MPSRNASGASTKANWPAESEVELVRVSAANLPAVTPADLRRLRGAPAAASGSVAVGAKFDSMIRRALLDTLRTGAMNAYQLWKAARVYSPQLQRTTVYQFLAGKRRVGIEYAEAMMRAAGLKIQEPRKRAG